MPVQVLTLEEWKATLRSKGGEYANFVLQNPQLLALTFDVMKEIAEKHYMDAGATAIGGAGDLAGKTKLSSGVKLGVRSTSFVVSQAKLSLGLRVVNGLSPGKAAAVIGATLVVKTGVILNLAGEEDKRTACVGALMEVGGNAAITAVTWETGVGAFIGLASIAASSLNAYNACASQR